MFIIDYIKNVQMPQTWQRIIMIIITILAPVCFITTLIAWLMSKSVVALVVMIIAFVFTIGFTIILPILWSQGKLD